jgi:hypothetical protein
MRNLFILFAFVFGLGQINAQITLERSDYTLEIGSDIYRTHINPDGVVIPSEGANQVWDYTFLVELDSDTIALEAYSGAEFSAANASRDLVTLQTVGPLEVPFERTNYFTLNDNEYGRAGVKFQSLAIPIAGITGNPADSINYLESIGNYPDNPGYFAWFPMNYGDIRTTNYTVNNEFLLTVTANFLDHVPCLNKVTGNSEYEAVGWGTLSLVNPADQSTVELEVLAMKQTTIEIDSFFIAGSPWVYEKLHVHVILVFA